MQKFLEALASWIWQIMTIYHERKWKVAHYDPGDVSNNAQFQDARWHRRMLACGTSIDSDTSDPKSSKLVVDVGIFSKALEDRLKNLELEALFLSVSNFPRLHSLSRKTLSRESKGPGMSSGILHHLCL